MFEVVSTKGMYGMLVPMNSKVVRVFLQGGGINILIWIKL